MRAPLLVGTVIALGALAGAILLDGCAKQCEDDSYCLRTCDCRDAQTDRVFECPLQFKCETDRRVCEEDYTALTCEDICNIYARRDLCGSQRCRSEADCVREVVCQVQDQNTGQVSTFSCERTFSCDAEAFACEAGYSASDNQICQECAVTGI